jgi:hypothetical protein
MRDEVATVHVCRLTLVRRIEAAIKVISESAPGCAARFEVAARLVTRDERRGENQALSWPASHRIRVRIGATRPGRKNYTTKS